MTTVTKPKFRLIKNDKFDLIKPAALKSNITLIASGKGGVGKTWLSISLCHALANMGHKVLLFDGDLGLANVDIQLGLVPEYDLSEMLSGVVDLDDVISTYEAGGFDVAAGQSGSGQLADLMPEHIVFLKESLKYASGDYDKVFVDLGAGIGGNIRLLTDVAAECLVVITDEPTSLTDAYAFIKVTSISEPQLVMKIVVNQADSELAGRRTYNTLLKVCENFLGLRPELAGVIRKDLHVKDTIKNQMSLLQRFPSCDASKDVVEIARLLGRVKNER